MRPANLSRSFPDDWQASNQREREQCILGLVLGKPGSDEARIQTTSLTLCFFFNCGGVRIQTRFWKKHSHRSKPLNCTSSCTGRSFWKPSTIFWRPWPPSLLSTGFLMVPSWSFSRGLCKCLLMRASQACQKFQFSSLHLISYLKHQELSFFDLHALKVLLGSVLECFLLINVIAGGLKNSKPGLKQIEILQQFRCWMKRRLRARRSTIWFRFWKRLPG